MARTLNEKMYPCRIATSGVLHELGCITGPVPFCRLTQKQIELLVMNGRIVFEKNPSDLNAEFRLLPGNMNDHIYDEPKETRSETPVEEIPSVVPEVREIPVEETAASGFVTMVPENTEVEVATPEKVEKVDTSKMTKKERKEYYRAINQAKQEQKESEIDPSTPDL